MIAKKQKQARVHEIYRIPMKGIEDEHLSTIDEDSDGDCSEECKVDADKSYSDEADEKDDGDDDDHVDGRA